MTEIGKSTSLVPMAAESKTVVFPLPGNSLGDPNFYSRGPAPVPDDSNNGNVGWDQDYGADTPKTLTGPPPWKDLKTGR